MHAYRPVIPVLVACALALGGCAANRAHPPAPEADLPGQFHSPVKSLAPATSQASPWWHALGDPALNGLIERALAGNLQL
jgi:outer membrane protein TolC